jgi:carbohydrate kinase (thermoresistant glucokinase family)
MSNLHVVVMGVSGCGKTTIGKLIATHYGAEFVDADGLHPQSNIEKMSQGIPLTDEDRWPWLATVGRVLSESNSLVIACSALKVDYREEILKSAADTLFVHLHGSRELLHRRMNLRSDHFMPASLLDSQLATLELLRATEPGYELNIADSETDIVTKACKWIDSRQAILKK